MQDSVAIPCSAGISTGGSRQSRRRAGRRFVFLAAHAVLGEMVKHSKPAIIVNFAAGLVLIALLN